MASERGESILSKDGPPDKLSNHKGSDLNIYNKIKGTQKTTFIYTHVCTYKTIIIKEEKVIDLKESGGIRGE